jgi:hypothetical protein
VRKLGPALDEPAVLLALPRRRFPTLAKGEVPGMAGPYVINQEKPFEVFYAGKAKTVRGPLAAALRTRYGFGSRP